MYAIQKLSKDELDFLYAVYPRGRPLNLNRREQSNGDSHISSLANAIKNVLGVEQVPRWVSKRCEEVSQQLIDSALLLPWLEKTIFLSGGTVYSVVTRGRLLCLSRKGSELRLAVLFGNPDLLEAWLIAAWNCKTSAAADLPVKGAELAVPIQYDQVQASKTLSQAKRLATDECTRLQKAETRRTQRSLLFFYGLGLSLLALWFVLLLLTTGAPT